MAEPKVRFTRDDGSSYPAWNNKCLGDLFKKNNERNGNQFSEDRTISIASMSFNPNGNGADTNSLSVYKVLRVGDVAFEGHENKEFSHGRFVMNDIGDGIMSPRFSCMRPIVPMVSGFWKYYIHSEVVMRDILIRSTKKGTMMHELVFEDLFKQSIDVPCLEEQQKIADFLSSVDDVISTSEQEVANLETQKKAVMKKIFSQEVRFKRADGSDFSEWEEAKLGSLCKIVTGKLDANAMVKDGPYMFFTCSREDYRIDKYAFDGEAILIAGNGDVGHTKYYNGKFNAYQRTYVLMQFSKDAHYLQSAIDAFLPLAIREELYGSAMPYITLSTLTDLLLPIPCLEEQRLIADFLSDIDEAIAAAKKELELWKELKKGLLQQIFV